MATPGPPNSAATATVASSIDALLTAHAKHLKPGETLTFTLVKGPTSSSSDPAAPPLPNNAKPPDGSIVDFPRLAKFPVSVVRPDFAAQPPPPKANAAGDTPRPRPSRMYEQDVPEAKDESDEDDGDGDEDDEEAAVAAARSAAALKGTMMDMTGDAAPPPPAGKKKKRRRKWGRNAPPRRQWVLETEEEFDSSMDEARRLAERRRRGKKGAVAASSPSNNGNVRSRYEGVPEANTSHYVLLSVSPNGDGDGVHNGDGPPTLSVVPVRGFHSFAQPDKVHTLSMGEAERAISDQRANMSRYMMHAKSASAAASSEGGAVGVGGAKVASSVPSSGGGKKGMSRARLMGKLAAGAGAEEDDDVMGDVKFQSRTKGSVRARQELLASLGDGLTVDDDGVLGGGNDAEFGGKRSFGRAAQPTAKKSVTAEEEDRRRKRRKGGRGAGGDDDALKGGKGDTTAGATFEASAMGDDFYQRDVQAEYEDLDYDAQEQFDDDDVDLMEEVVDASGFGADDDDDDLDDDDEADSGAGGGGGLATAAGLRALMAKARGEQVEDPAVAGTIDARGKKTTAYNPPGAGMAAAAAAAEAAAAGAAGRSPALATAGTGAADAPASDEPPPKRARAEGRKDITAKPEPSASAEVGGVGFDEDGNRIISKETIQREIWLHHGQIKMKRLLKIFNISKKNSSPERQNRFRELVKELCTMKQTVEGNFLVLKQHYANL